MTRRLLAGRWPGVWLMCLLLAGLSSGQTVTTTTVQGTVYQANGAPASGTLLVNWPAFTTAGNQLVAAGSSVTPIGADGFVSLNLAPNLGSTPAGLFYTAVFQLSNGTVNTQYWVVPAAASATLAAVQSQLMPAAQAVQAVSKAYVDQSIAELQGSLLTANGGMLTGPLTLAGDPTTPLMAADKHYVDQSVAQAVPVAGGTMSGGLVAPSVNGVSSPVAGGSQATLQAAVTAAGANGAMLVPPGYAGTDAFTNAAGIRVEDMRTGVAQQHERSVKEFGAVCNGVVDDTLALQAAINYAQANNVALTLPAGKCRTQQLAWHGESIGGQGRQVSALVGFPGQDVLATATDATGLLSNTRLHDLTIYVDQSVDVSCSPAEGRAAAGSCGVSRAIEGNSIFSPGGNGLTGTAGAGAGWWIGNCAIAMPAAMGTGGNGLRQAEIENVAIATVGVDPLAGYAQADSTHTCGLYLGQWPSQSEFRNIAISGVGTGIAAPGLAVATPQGLVADANRWQNVTIAAVHGFVMVAGANNVLDGLQVNAGNSAAAGESPTGLVLDFGSLQQGWTVRNVQVQPQWVAVQPKLTVAASGGAVTGVAVGPEHGLGFEAYGPVIPLSFSGSCTAAANVAVNGDGSLGAVTVTAGGFGCSATTAATVNAAGTWMAGRPVNLVTGQNLTLLGGNLLKGNGGYTVWNAAGSRTLGTQLGGGGTLTASTTGYPALVVGADAEGVGAGYTGSGNRFDGLGLSAGTLLDSGLGNAVVQPSATGYGVAGVEPARVASDTVSADFALLGGGAPSHAFPSLNDLFFGAEDLYSPVGESVAAGSQFGKDAAAPVTGAYVKAMGGAWDTTGNWALRGVSGGLLLGKGFPSGSGTWYVAAKADAAATQELKLSGTTGSASCTFADQTVSLTTSWQVFPIAYNTVTGNSGCDSATGGNAVTAVGLAPSVATNVETAWISFVPAFQQLLVANQPTAPNQAANKQYVDAQIASQIVSGGGALPITGGTMTGPLNAPAINGTANCALGSSVSGCVAGAGSALIPPGTSGSYAQGAAMGATAQCVYDTTRGGQVTAVFPGQLGEGYLTAPAVTVSGGGGSGLAVAANVLGGAVTSYTATSGGSGYSSCPAIAVAAPPAAVAPVAVVDQRRGVTSYSADVRVDDFGCAADGVTDDTQCLNNAISYATQNGTRAGSVTLTQGKTYFIGTITGYMQTAWDDGTAPSSDTCGGVACTNIAPETPGYLGYAIRVASNQSTPLTIFGNGATIASSFTSTAAGAATYTMSAPYLAIFGSDGGIGGWNLYDLNFSNVFVGAATKSAAYWRWERVSMNGVGAGLLLGASQYDSFRQIQMQNASAGFVIGGWWGTRAPWTSASGGTFLNGENLGDSTVLDGILFYGRSWATQSQGQTAQNALDTWFNTYFFHVGDNQTRLTDQNQAGLGVATDSVWRGVYHVMFAMYSRYLRPVYSVMIHNANVKGTQNYMVVGTAPIGWEIDGLFAEQVGWCDGNASFGSYGSAGCPNPYDSVNNQLPGAVLLYEFQQMNFQNIQDGASPILETVAEPWQVSAGQQLSDFRSGMTNVGSYSASSQTARTQPVPTGRLVLSDSSGTLPPGGTNVDSGELCLKGVNGGYGDEWCMRGVEQTYTSGFGMPRYLTIENDGYPGFTGSTAVQMPGLRVRPGAINGTDGMLPVTDFAEQAFAIAGGAVNGESCATVPGITLTSAAATDGVLFVKGPSVTTPLQLGGSVTGANTLQLTVCNPSTGTLSYPAGTYYAFLLGGAAVSGTPAVSGGAAVATNPLTTSQGDLVVGGASGNPTRLAGNVTATTAVLTQQGTGTGANVPVWQTAPTFYGGNLTGLNAGNITTGAVGISNGGTGGTTAAQALTNLGGANLSASVTQFTGALTANQLGGLYQVDRFAGGDLGAKLTACIAGLSATYGGICDARNFAGMLAMGSTVTVSTANTTIYLPCGTIATTSQIVVPAGVRNVTLHGCGLRGASTASGSQGGTVLLYSGGAAAVQVGDPTYGADTMGFHMDNLLINITNSTSASAQAVVAYRTQELDLESLYLLGNQNQTAMTLDGTGNYTGGTFYDLGFNGFQTAVNGIGHQVANPATTDWMNASTFIRLHIDCPESGGSPISGTYGINLQQGDGNTFDGGDVEGCATALHLGANAQNNTIVGLRNEVSNSQVVADAGSQFNSWITGGTMFTGQLTDNGSRNSFLDSFHRTFNGMKGDWYASQQDATVTNHLRLGTGAGNVRGLLWESQVDVGTASSQYNWAWGLTDGLSGQSNWIFQDLINNTIRLQMQENNAAGNNGTALNGTGTGNVCFQCSANSGTGGVAFSSGGAAPATVATVDSSGNANFLGTFAVSGVTTDGATVTVKNQADAEIDSVLWAGLTASQKESFIYKDWNGNSQWYMVKDASNNWALNSAVDGLDHLKAYQGGDTYINAAGTGVVRVNSEANAGSGGFKWYSGGVTPAVVASMDNGGNLTVASCSGCGGGTTGSVTSVGLALPGDFTVSGSPVTGSGTLTGAWATTPTGTGAVVRAAGPTIAGPTISGPTVTGTATLQGNVTLQNGTNSTQTLAIQPGSSAEQTGGLQWNSYSGTSEWLLRKDASNYLRLNDLVNSLDRLVLYQNGETMLNAGAGANVVGINNNSGSGTGGLIVYGGGASYSTVGWQTTGAGVTTQFGSGSVATASTATSGTSYAAPARTWSSSYWNGSAAATDQWTMTPSIGNGTNGASTLTINHSGSTGTAQLTVGPTLYAQSGLVSNGNVSANGGGTYTSTSGSAATSGTCAVGGSYKTVGAYWNGAASAADTVAMTPSCTAGTNGAETLTISNSGSTGAFTTVVSGGLQAATEAGTGTMTLATGAAAGTSPTIVCAASHVCDGVSGTATLTTGTAPATGTLATLTFPAAHSSQANCMVSVQLAGSGQVTTVGWSESTTAVTLTANAALTASTAYTVKYWCGGN